ncbi:MAG: N-acetylmuramoyl-L-alanine amidase [Ferruginibacter sp.]
MLKNKKLPLFIVTFFFFVNVMAQTEKPFIKLVEPLKENNRVSSSRQFIVGSTCKTCSVIVNDSAVKVYATGAFAYEINLAAGDTSFNIIAKPLNGKSISKKLNYTYILPKPAEPVTTVNIETIQTFPEGNLVLQTGDKIDFKVKALPGATIQTFNNTELYELPISQTNGMPGIYQGTYMVKATDSFAAIKFPLTLIAADGQSVTKETKNSFSIMSPLSSDIAVTTGRLAYLLYGLGEDRLGGAKIGYIDSLIPLKIIGKVGDKFKIQLAKGRTAYIEDDKVTLMPKGSYIPDVISGSWRVYGDSVYDYVNIALNSRLLYQSFQEINPSKIVVDIFGATSNTNWITQLESAKEITSVDYQQITDDILRVTIQLKHPQHWGHQVYYKGNMLVIKIKQQPKSLLLKNLTIAIDAGHGGSNTGAGGPTGSIEKMLTLSVSLKLQKTLQALGVKVIMTRTTERFFDNKERILFYRDNTPDLLISLHLNSAGDPIRTSGTSTYYRYVGFRNLSLDIYKQMLQLGLKEYGNTGSFNFMLNSPTEYPNALVEMLFLSNPAEEQKILDESFQQQVADKIVAGVKDFLKGCKSTD